MSNTKHKVKLQVLLASAAAAGVFGLSARPAHADWHEGYLPNSVPDCRYNSHIGGWHDRITSYNRQTGSVEDYGWLEWRYSSRGECNGYQWIRLHIERGIPITQNDWLWMATCRSDGVCIYPGVQAQCLWSQGCRVGGLAWDDAASVLYPGVYDLALFYSPTLQSCASFLSYVTIGSSDIFSYEPLYAYTCG